MRNRADLRSLGFVALAATAHFCAVLLPLPLIAYPAWLLLSSLLSFCACVINHNHVHEPVFRRRRANRVFGIALTLAKGHTSHTVIVPHNLNHHVFTGTPEHAADWIEVGIVRDTPAGPARVFRYVWRASRAMRISRGQPGAPALDARRQADLKLEKFALALFSLGLGAVNPGRFVLWVGVPWLLAMIFLVAVNLFQHDGCEPASDWNHSRNFTGRWTNWLLFNNGYHTIHHRHPDLHWSRLRVAHDEDLAGKIRSDLNEVSLLGFIARAYFWPFASAAGRPTATVPTMEPITDDAATSAPKKSRP